MNTTMSHFPVWNPATMIIPYATLSPEALRGVVEEFVSREGTEYGARDYSLEEKVDQVIAQLRQGEALIDYDPDTRTCHLCPTSERKAP